jgi:hypothetical protein
LLAINKTSISSLLESLSSTFTLNEYSLAAVLFNKTDLYHFLMMTSFDHLADVQNAYRMLFDSEIARCPFDSQEQIMLQVMKWLYHNDDAKL